MADRTRFDLAASPGQLLHRAQQFAAERFAAAMDAGEKLTQRQFAVLAGVAAQPGLTQTELVRITGIDRSTLAELIARMVRKGLLRRERMEGDARANAVHLGPEGEAAYAAALPGAEAADAAILDALPKGKRAAFLETLRRIARRLEDGDAPADGASGKGGKKEKKKKKKKKKQKK